MGHEYCSPLIDWGTASTMSAPEPAAEPSLTLEEILVFMRDCVKDNAHAEFDAAELATLLGHIGKLQAQIDAVKYYESITETTP